MPPAASDSLSGRYERIIEQLIRLLTATTDPIARMATMAALLHHKNPHYFWTGFYRLQDGKLVVGPYQGPLACSILPEPNGICWACVRRGESVVVPDVHAFPGHVACDERSKSEIVVPVRNAEGRVVGVLDVDSDRLNAFGNVDQEALERIAAMVFVRRPA
jgi:L-methionine (R)-S-oxide reductase